MNQSLPHAVTVSWERVRQRLAEELPEKAFELWLANSALTGLVRGSLRVGFPSEMMMEYARDNFGELIARIASEEMGQRMKVDFYVDDALLAKMGQAGTRLAAAMAGLAAKPATERGLEGFIKTKGNRRVLEALRHVVEGRLPRLDPLLITGESGSGKSHLAEAALAAFEAHGKHAILLRGKEFAERLAHGWRARRHDAMRAELERYEVIIFDDLEALGHKHATQRELSLVIQDLSAREGQLVLFAEQAPSAVPGLDEPLVSLLESGLIVEIEAPDRDETVRILARIQAELGRDVPDEVLAALVDAVPAGIAERARAASRMIAHARLSEEPLDEGFVARHLAEFAGREDPSARRTKLIFALIEEHFDVSREDLLSKRKTQTLSAPRGLIVVLLRQHVGMTFKEIGQLLGQRSHTSIYLMHKKYEDLLLDRPEFSALVREVGRRILVAS